MGLRIGTAAIVLAVAIGVRAIAATPAPANAQTPAPQKTTKDKVFSKEQAARGAEMYARSCDRCHDPAKVAPGKKPGPQTIGPKFLENWQDKTLGELYGTIFNTMPGDGVLILTADQTIDLVAYLLQANGFPAGEAPLKNDDAMKAVVIAPIK
jgi:S-disulfanyl-L-cysteine oxidoreductase SoxD